MTPNSLSKSPRLIDLPLRPRTAIYHSKRGFLSVTAKSSARLPRMGGPAVLLSLTTLDRSFEAPGALPPAAKAAIQAIATSSLFCSGNGLQNSLASRHVAKKAMLDSEKTKLCSQTAALHIL